MPVPRSRMPRTMKPAPSRLRDEHVRDHCEEPEAQRRGRRRALRLPDEHDVLAVRRESTASHCSRSGTATPVSTKAPMSSIRPPRPGYARRSRAGGCLGRPCGGRTPRVTACAPSRRRASPRSGCRSVPVTRDAAVEEINRRLGRSADRRRRRRRCDIRRRRDRERRRAGGGGDASTTSGCTGAGSLTTPEPTAMTAARVTRSAAAMT